MGKNYCLTITSHVQTFQLPETIRCINELKIAAVKYRTAGNDQKLMHIKINGFDQSICIRPDGTHFNYTKLVILPSIVNQEVLYESRGYDIFTSQYNSTNINSLTFQIFIDYLPASSFVTLMNPLILELKTR